LKMKGERALFGKFNILDFIDKGRNQIQSAALLRLLWIGNRGERDSLDQKCLILSKFLYQMPT
jgi:hypothetical protein